ncbi:efflux RND transporter periplasmic adaptor subunit [Umezawaea endophytica]
MRVNAIAPLCALLMTTTACQATGPDGANPDLSPRGTALTRVKPTRKDLTTTLSLAGTVTMRPTIGLVAPVAGKVRFVDLPASDTPSTTPVRVATVSADGTAHPVEIPAGTVFAGRLVDDGATVTAGMPIASAEHTGYGIVAGLDAGQAYQVSGATSDVRAQIENGPGPFPCAVLGTIAALPAGTAPESTPEPSGEPASRSAATGLRVVCAAPGDVTLINGASASVELVTGRSANALAVPVEAVAGRRDRGRVDVLLPDGSRRTTDVVLGLTDGQVVEVTSGLTGDEELAVPGPDLPDPAQDGATTPTGQRR